MKQTTKERVIKIVESMIRKTLITLEIDKEGIWILIIGRVL
jgi:hypothetical protein